MRILLVEDEIKLANAVKRALEFQKYTVDIANDGKLGLDLAVGEKYDLIILDLMLPHLSGLQICAAIRAEKISTPVLILTAKGEIDDKITGLDSGADDYMVKPFSFEELFARIRSLVRRATNSDDNILTVDNLSLNTVTFKVTRANTNINLSSKEFAILEYLLRHIGAVVTKDQIIQSVWNYDTDILPSTIEVHIKHLRDKIDAPFQIKLISTVRGFGYEIKA